MPKPDRLTSTDYAHPHRSSLVRLYNGAGSLVGGRALSVEAMLAAARNDTGLEDFGDDAFREPLARLVDSIEREARLNPLGRTIMRGRTVSMLANRLRIEALYRAHPEIETQVIERPIVIAGLQRTGTTMLHRLLAADPRVRALSSWEALNPAPLPGEGERGSNKRRRKAKLAEVGLRAIAPDFFAIHPVEADAPEEDVLLLDHVFTTQAPEATLHVPSYAAWLETHDLVPSYRYLARVLRLLAWQRGGARWVLKTPHHLEFLGELLTVFPGAVIVQTHRDPQATMGSFCSMVAHARGIFSDEVDPREVGRHWLRKVRRMIDRSLAVRDRNAGPRSAAMAPAIVDVSYYDLIADPLAEVRRIYARAGIALTGEAEAAMREVNARNVRNRHGRHVYRSRDFGLSPTLVEETFADYRARFSIRRETLESDTEVIQQNAASGVGHKNVIAATLTGITDLMTTKGSLAEIDASLRLDGKTALVTGASSGLGRAIAIDLARRGARLILPLRSGIPSAGEEIAKASGAPAGAIEMLPVDLADLDSVAALADVLAARRASHDATLGLTLDLVVCNAGLMPVRPKQTAQGYEMMFGVHYLANHLLVRKLLASGVIPNDVYAQNGRSGSDVPRVVFVNSESHRSCSGLDFERFGAPVSYGVTDGVAHYGCSKLAQTTFSTELARRLTLPGGPSVAIHSLCPGPVDSRIARDAPPFIRTLLAPVMSTFFRSPERAAAPVIYLLTAPDIAGDTGWYLHLMRHKTPSDWALDPDHGREVFERGEAILEPWLRESAAG